MTERTKVADEVATYTEGLMGKSVPRQTARRLATGRGRYLDDIDAGVPYHVAFYRSPYARARFTLGDLSAAQKMPGILRVVTGEQLSTVCAPWVTRLEMLPEHVSAPQHPLAISEVYWQGEPVVAVVAKTRAQAEDALDVLEIDWHDLEPVVDAAQALQPESPLAHPQLPSNLALQREIRRGDVEAALSKAACVVQHRFSFGRQTGVPLEARGVVARYDPRTEELVVYQSHQSPFQMQEIYAKQLSMPLSQVRVLCPDVGGAFGIKLHAYPDEMAAVAIAKLLAVPIKYQADRLESFVSDAHAREAVATAQLALDGQGRILGLSFDALFTFGAVSLYPRSSVGEALQVLEMCGMAYKVPALHGRVRGAFVNKVPSGAYRAVGQPLASAIIEQLLDNAAASLGMDRLEIRRKNYIVEADLAGDGDKRLRGLSLHQCLDTLKENIGYEQLRQRQEELRTLGVYRGIGLCTFIEQTGVGAGLYGRNGVPVAGKESVRLQLGASGQLTCYTSASESGQGAHTGLAQIIADGLGCPMDAIVVRSGDTQVDPTGGGSWASRGIALGGEAANRAARQLRANVLAIVSAWKSVDVADLEIDHGVVSLSDGEMICSLQQVARLAHYDSTQIPLADIPSLSIECSYSPFEKPYFMANGIQAAEIELDAETGQIRVLDFWVVEDCGTVINPLLVDEQIRGGVVQGIGAALFEHCIYSDTGQMSNASLADYLVPMASEMPDIHVAHVSTPEKETGIGAKGVGEAGTVGSIGAIWSAVNDALRPLEAAAENQPFTPDVILSAILRKLQAD